MVLTIVSVFVLLTLGVVEFCLHNTHVGKIPVRILVNGTRGKTTVTRLIASGLRESGLKVLAKTTGSEAAILMPDGTVQSLKRRFGVNVLRETFGFFSLANRLNVQAVVLECMALRPENQILMCRMTRPTVSVITNARVDHTDVMGESIASSAQVLKLSVPENYSFYTSDIFFADDSSAVVVNAGPSPAERNKALVLRILKDLGVPESTAVSGMAKAVPDIGLTGPFRFEDRLIINAFASNDMQSARELLTSIGSLKDVCIIYNNRSDREFRLKFFAEVFRELSCPRIIVIGDNLSKCVRFFKRKVPSSSVSPLIGTDSELLSLCGSTTVCMGNIKGRGTAFVEFCRKNGQEVR